MNVRVDVANRCAVLYVRSNSKYRIQNPKLAIRTKTENPFKTDVENSSSTNVNRDYSTLAVGRRRRCAIAIASRAYAMCVCARACAPCVITSVGWHIPNPPPT